MSESTKFFSGLFIEEEEPIKVEVSEEIKKTLVEYIVIEDVPY